MSKVLLINPNNPIGGYLAQQEPFPNGACLILGTILKNHGHKVRLVHMGADKVDLPTLKALVRGFRPDLVAITMNTFQVKAVKDISKGIKEISGGIKVVIGGPHPSALISMDEPILEEFSNVDIAVSGEGDSIILELANGGLGNGIYTPTNLKDLNYVPFVDLGLVDIRNFTGTYPPGPQAGMFIMGSRGCPFHCSFCSRSVFGKEVRYRPPEVIVEEAERLHADWGIREIFFHDDTFNLNRKWAEDVLTLIIKKGLNKGITFRTPCRANQRLMDSDLLGLMRKANFWLVFYGVESGSQSMLNSMGKDLKIEEIKETFRLTREAGIRTEASFIIGLPGETKETVMDSLKLWKEIKPDWGGFSRAIPFPGTELYSQVKKKKHLLVSNFEEYELNKTMVRTDLLSGEDLEYYALMADRMVSRWKLKGLIKRPGTLRKVIGNILKSKGGFRRGIKRLWRLR